MKQEFGPEALLMEEALILHTIIPVLTRVSALLQCVSLFSDVTKQHLVEVVK